VRQLEDFVQSDAGGSIEHSIHVTFPNPEAPGDDAPAQMLVSKDLPEGSAQLVREDITVAGFRAGWALEFWFDDGTHSD
jgi:hypothetical protein